MGSLNVPFLMFSWSNFVLNQTTCYAWIITETDIEENETYVPENKANNNIQYFKILKSVDF